MQVIIVGGGKMVYFLARTFLAKGYNVTVINNDVEEGVKLARHFHATIVNGDGSNPQILEEAGAYSADTVLAVTPNDQENLIIGQLAGKKFHVPQIIASVNDPDNEVVFRQLGIKAIATTRILANVIEQKTGFEDIINLTPIAEGRINMTEILLNGTSPVIGKSLIELALPENSLIAAILRGNDVIIPRGPSILQAHDQLIVMTTPENHGKVLKMLTGDNPE